MSKLNAYALELWLFDQNFYCAFSSIQGNDFHNKQTKIAILYKKKPHFDFIHCEVRKFNACCRHLCPCPFCLCLKFVPVRSMNPSH